MNKLSIASALAIVSFSTSQFALAEEAKQLSWKAAAELGFIMTSGNSETESLNAKFKASTEYSNWKHSLNLEALNSSSNNVSSAERYFAEAQSDRALSDRAYALGVISYEKDRFSGYDHQLSVALGAGYKAIAESNMSLAFEVAPGYRVIEDNNGNNEEDAIIRAAENFSWKLSDTSSIEQFLHTEAGKDNTISRFGISLSSQIQEALSMKLGYTLKHRSEAPASAASVDRETTITLVYKI